MQTNHVYAMALWRVWRINVWPWRHLPHRVLRKMGAA